MDIMQEYKIEILCSKTGCKFIAKVVIFLQVGSVIASPMRKILVLYLLVHKQRMNDLFPVQLGIFISS